MSIKTDAEVIRDEVSTSANTATRIGTNLVDIADDLIAKQAEIDLNTAKVSFDDSSDETITGNWSYTNNLGVGSETPLARLDIDNELDEGTGFTRVVKITAGVSNDDGGYIEFSSSSADGYGAQIGGIREGAGGAGAIIVRTGTNSQTERLRVANNGDVTIQENLSVVKKINAADCNFSALPTYADDTAAASLSTGDLYKTVTGELRIKL